jgi:tetratricopeptide (TPR) repeat protein
MSEAAQEFFRRGEELLSKGDNLGALNNFEKSMSLDSSSALCRSYVALLMASERGQVHRAVELAAEALNDQPDKGLLYLNLGKLYLRAGRKTDAIEVVRKGLACGDLPQGIEFLESMGNRRKPVFSFLPRKNFLNKYAGLLIKKLTGNQ